METTTWEVCSFIRVLLKKKQSAFGLLQGRGRTCFIRVLLKKKQSAFQTAGRVSGIEEILVFRIEKQTFI